MQRLISTIVLIVCMAIIGTAWSARAQMASMDEALTVATNWITMIIQEKGDWGGAEAAEVAEIEEFKRGDRLVGYFCRVDPKGYIVVSLRREMAPVKAYSAVSDLDPASEEGMADLLKGSMERLLDKIQTAEDEAQAKSAPSADIFEIDYRSTWEELEGDPDALRERLQDDTKSIDEAPEGNDGSPEAGAESGGEESNYLEGEVLLTSNWHQSPPYNDDCPWLGCSNSNGRAIVGCVATAGAQIMRYWNWPPYGVGSPYNDSYDWRNMLDSVTDTSPQAQIDAVAELNAEVGQAVGMSYGCSASSAYTWDMEDVFEDHYRYSTLANKVDRPDYTAIAWFDLMKGDFNFNRPVQYRIPGHSIVGDGWQEIGGTPTRQYHMNYGWASTSTDTWYTLDALSGGDPDEEYMIRTILPTPYVTTLGNAGETFTRDTLFPYRYFYRDVIGVDGTWAGGQGLQFLPGITARSTGLVEFESSPTFYSRLFTRGDLSRGIVMYPNSVGAGINLHANGSIQFE